MLEGKGTPRPFSYHPHMEGQFNARVEELHRQERIYVVQAKRKAGDKMNAASPPSAPKKPRMPGLFDLRAFEGSVTLPWS